MTQTRPTILIADDEANIAAEVGATVSNGAVLLEIND